jgi:hypothetical protein
MRSIYHTTVVFGLTLLALAAGSGHAAAQGRLPLIQYDSTWRYNEAGVNLLTAWRAPGYNDSAWPEGQGLLAAEGPGIYPEPFLTTLTAPDMGGPLTTYYRIRFNFETNVAGVTLTVTNYIDDGMVAYLNNTEIFRFNMPAGTPAFGTAASAANPLGEGVPHVTNVVASGLVVGTNVLAVEVHQSAANSSDVVFGLSMIAELPGPIAPIVITNQPQSQVVQVGRRGAFTVGVRGSNPYYRWFVTNAPPGSGFNNGPIAGAAGLTNFTYTTPVAASNMSGVNFYCVVTNAVSTNRSDNAVMTVVPDVFGPLLVTAIADDGFSNRISITFDESVNADSARPLSNYVISLQNRTNTLNIFSNQVSGSTVRLFTTEGLISTNKYILTVNNVRDSSSNNVIAPDSQIGISFRFSTNVIGFAETWRFAGLVLDCSIANTNWKALNYNDNPNLPPFAWSDGGAMFWNSQEPGFNPPCTSKGVQLSLGPPIYYFRKKFNLTTNFGPDVSLSLNRVVDDGVVLYLNEVEIFRERMPAGPVGCNTRASAQVGNATCVSNAVAIDSSILRRGTNILAVELHQVTGDIADAAWDLRMDIQYLITPTLSAETNRLRWVRVAPNTLNFSWGGHGWALEGATNVLGPWLEVQPLSTNMTVSISGAQQFFRLHRVNQ